jgi:hypothetical protein
MPSGSPAVSAARNPTLTPMTARERLMPRKAPCCLRRRPPPLTVDQVLVWADHHHARTNRWPHAHDGPVLADCNEK